MGLFNLFKTGPVAHGPMVGLSRNAPVNQFKFNPASLAPKALPGNGQK